MRSLVLIFWGRITQSFWVIPSLLAFMAILLSFAMTWVDSALENQFIQQFQWVYNNHSEGARSVLSTIAGSMITVAGVVFSTTIVVLTLASQQYGPRLVRNFIKDKPSQFVLGAFTGCFIYNILILRNMRGGDEHTFIPHLSIMMGVVLAIVCIGLMIYFIHHVSMSIQVQSIMTRVKSDLDLSMERLFPEMIDRPVEDESESGLEWKRCFAEQSADVFSKRSGYIQAIRDDKLVEILIDCSKVVQLCKRPGDFILEGEKIGEVNDSESESLPIAIENVFVVGPFPTHEQDLLFPIKQLEEMAIRALSPGVNDPHTALECVDYLALSLSTLAQRPWPSPFRYDKHGDLRVIAHPYSFEEILRHAFGQIVHYGCKDVTVIERVISALVRIAERVKRDGEKRRVIREMLKEIGKKVDVASEYSIDKTRLNDVLNSALSAI